MDELFNLTMILTERDEVFYNLFKQECYDKGLTWYYSEVNNYGLISFAPKEISFKEFFHQCINLINLSPADRWFQAYTGLMKWVVEQDVTKITPQIITAGIWQYGLDNNIKGLEKKEDCQIITDLIYKNSEE